MMREQNRKREQRVQEMRTVDAAGKGASVMEDGTGAVLRSPATGSSRLDMLSASVMEDGTGDVLRNLATESTGAEMAGVQHMAVRDVIAGYHGKVVLDGLSFEVPRGGILVLIGPNGAGKSTVLRTLSRALLPMQGTVTLDGRDLQRYSGEALARELAVMLTDRAKPELMTVRDVVSLGRYPYTWRLGRLNAEDEVQVKDAMVAMDVMELRERDFRELSDGQKQRVLLARALAQDPKLLILDEPTGYLDIHYKLQLLRVLRAKAQAGMTIVASLHEIELARLLADQLLTVKDGHAGHSGTPEEIFREEIIAPLYDISAEEFRLLYGRAEERTRL